MAKEEKKVARKRFDEIMGVAKRHHLANLLKDRDAKLWCLNGIAQMTDRLHQSLLR